MPCLRALRCRQIAAASRHEASKNVCRRRPSLCNLPASHNSQTTCAKAPYWLRCRSQPIVELRRAKTRLLRINVKAIIGARQLRPLHYVLWYDNHVQQTNIQNTDVWPMVEEDSCGFGAVHRGQGDRRGAVRGRLGGRGLQKKNSSSGAGKKWIFPGLGRETKSDSDHFLGGAGEERARQRFH